MKRQSILVLIALVVSAAFTAVTAQVVYLGPRNVTVPAGATRAFRVLQANVGNADLGCSGSKYKLCYQSWENGIKNGIASVNPDVILLQEVFPDWLCRQGQASASNQVCYNFRTRTVRDQVRRLVGSNYTIVCDWGHGWDCIALKKSISAVSADSSGRACPPGYFCANQANHSIGDTSGTREALFANYQAVYNTSSYDSGFHMLFVNAVVNGVAIRIINGHPQSGGTGSGSKETARKTQLVQALGTWAAGQPRVLIGGDLNMDPYRYPGDVSVAAWKNYVDNYDSNGSRTATKTYWYHSGVAENGGTWLPNWTTDYIWPLANYTYDHVLSNFLYGSCRTLSGVNRLDGGQGMDHIAQDCTLFAY